MKFLRYPALFLSVYFCISCGPSYHNIIITPALGTGMWQEGREYTEKTVKKVKVTVAFEKIDENDMVYNITITNNGKINILFDPAAVFCNGYFEPKTDSGTQPAGDALNTAKPDVVITANDPEVMLSGVAKEKVSEKSSYETDQAANDAAACAGCVGGIAADSDKERRDADRMQRDAEQDSIHRENEHMMRMQKLEDRTAYYEKETLRKTTVLPGQTIKGKIHLPVNLKVKLMVLSIPLDSLQFDFAFGQIIEKPVQKQSAVVK